MNKQAPSIGFYNGKFCSINEMAISPDSPAVERSYAVYEFFRIHNGHAFYFERHMDRLFRSLEILRLNIKFDRKELQDIIYKLIAKNEMADFYIKIYAIPQDISNLDTPSNLFILPCQVADYDDEIYKNGASLLMKEYCRFLPEAKSTNYIASVFWQKEMKSINAVDVLFYQNNTILECSRGNIFIVKNGKVSTPSENILKGISRSIVIDLMTQNSIPFEERDISAEELFEADEAWISSTTKLVIPVVKINDKLIANGNSGQMTQKILHLFKNLLK
jgi:branched-subunit amino acid aminotransferase/4-amino-4-deoxychorismate lyase